MNKTRIKICGLRDVSMAQTAARLGADAIGLVFYPASPRAVTLEMAAKIAYALPPFVSRVGLFVNAHSDMVTEVLQQVPLDLLQFHGDEPAAFCRSFDRPYLKAVRVKPGLDLLEYAACYPDACGLLVDAFVEGVPGGTGAAFDWSLLPQSLPMPLVLSGGLHPGNVGPAISLVRPWAVDVSSGVESSKGVKDVAKIAAFIDEVNCAGEKS